MKTSIIKKIVKIYGVVLSYYFFSTTVVHATLPTTAISAEGVFQNVVTAVFNPLYRLAVGIAIVYFMFGVVKFIYDLNDPEKKTTGKEHLLWGSIGLFIILSVGGILQIINGVLGGMFQY